MALEELILRYYLKLSSISIILFASIISLYAFYLINKKIIIHNNIIEINRGENINQIIDILDLNNNFFNKKIFKYYYKIYSFSNSNTIHFGDFYIDKNLSFKKILDIITKPSNILNKFSIIEGWSKYDLKKELEKKFFETNLQIQYKEILADTYYFKKNEDLLFFYQKLKKYKKDYFNKFQNNPLYNKFTEDEFMIIGSLIEKEGLDYNDKRNISSVIFNRLNINMKLQIDATVLYAITDGKYNLDRNLLLNDLKIDNPYNTYINYGLPPNPISFVGTKTIDIIFENYKTDYLFYFFNKSLDKHVFSKTYEEHRNKLNEYRKK